jgi:hypothetical protein
MNHSNVTAAAPLAASGLTHFQASASLFGLMVVCLVLALFLRRRTPGITASIERRSLVQRSGGAVKTLRHVRTALAWCSFLLFGVAGVAASGTFVGTCVLWASHTVEGLAGHLPVLGQQIIGGGALLLGLVFLHKGLHLLGDVLEGKAHQGGADMLMFLGPMVFTLVPGYFGEGAAWVYAGMANHIVPVVQHLV